MFARKGLLLVAVLCCLGVAGSTLAAPCDSAYVKVGRKTVTVLPTGGNDTANLQCAIDLATQMGSGITVQLAAGVFQTEQLVVQGLRGTIRGMGQAATVINNVPTTLTIDHPCGGQECFADAPPSPSNRYPSLISILGNDLTLADLTVAIDGASTDLWHMWTSEISSLANAVQVIGSYCTMRVQRVTVHGGTVAVSPFMIWSFSRPWVVTGSNLSISGSTFGPSGVAAYNLKHVQIVFSGNQFDMGERGTALSVGDNSNTLIQFTGNKVTASGADVVGVYGWPGYLGTGVKASSLVVDSNVLAGESALVIEPGAFNDVSCRASGNILQVTGTPFVLNGNPCAIGTKRK